VSLTAAFSFYRQRLADPAPADEADRLAEGPAAAGEDNGLRRDVLVKRTLGLDQGPWERAGTLLRLQREADAPLPVG